MRNPNKYAKYKGRYYNDAQSESDDDDSILDDFVVDEESGDESESSSDDQNENSCTSNSQKTCKDSPKRPKRLDSDSQSTPDNSQELNVSKSARRSAKRLESSSSESEQSADQQEEVRIKRKRRKARIDSDRSDSNEPEEPGPSGATPRRLLRSSSRSERLSALKKQQDDETKQEWRRKRQQSRKKRLKLDVSPKQHPEPIKEEVVQISPVVCSDTTADNSYNAWKQAGAEVDKPRFVICKELYRDAPNLLGRRLKLIGRIVDILVDSDEGCLLEICGSNTEHKCRVKIPMFKNQEDKEKFKTGTVVEFCGELEEDKILICTFFLFPEINVKTFNLCLHEQSIVAGRKYGSPAA